MFDKTYLLHEQRRQDMMKTAARERLARFVQSPRQPAVGRILAWTGRRMVDAGRRMQRLADSLGSESAVTAQRRTS